MSSSLFKLKTNFNKQYNAFVLKSKLTLLESVINRWRLKLIFPKINCYGPISYILIRAERPICSN